MTDRHLIEHKLKRIEGFLREIKQVEINSFKAFKGDIVKKRFIERNLQLSIEEMIDICKHIVSSLDMPEPETYKGCLEQLAKRGIINKRHLATYKEMVGFRNILIHAYEGIDEQIVYGIYKKNLGDFLRFISDIRNFLRKEKR